MWLWVGVGLGAFVALSLLIALAFASVLARLNRDMTELLEYRAGSASPTGVSDRRAPGRREPLSRASATR